MADDPPPLSDTDLLQFQLCKWVFAEDLEGVQRAISEGADPNVVSFLGESRPTTALHVACYLGNLEIIKWLVEHGNARLDIPIPVTGYAHCEALRHIEVLRWLIFEAGAPVDFADEEYKRTLLHDACCYGLLSTVEFLVSEANASVNLQDCYGQTPIFDAIRKGHLSIVSWMLDKCKEVIDLHLVDHSGFTPFHQACASGHLEIAKVLFPSSTELLAMSACFTDSEHGDKHDNGTPLHLAAWKGHIDVVKWLVAEKGVSTEIRDSRDRTPLFSACRGDHLDIAKWLVNQANARADHETTILMYACEQGSFKTAKWIVDDLGQTVNDHDSDECTACWYAAGCGHLEIVQWLVKEKNAVVDLVVPVDGGEIINNTPLTIAASKGRSDVVKWLVQHGGASIEGCDKFYTPLTAAVVGGHLDTAQILVGAGADINTTNKDGQTLLHKACEAKHLGIVQWLISLEEVDVDYTDSDGETALHTACQYGNVQIVKWLVECTNATIDRHASEGHTPFVLASIEGHLDVMKVLLLNGNAYVDSTDNIGYTALLSASLRGHISIVEWLLGPARASTKKRSTETRMTAYDIAKDEGGDLKRAFDRHFTKVQQCWDLVGYLATKSWFTDSSRRINGGRKLSHGVDA